MSRFVENIVNGIIDFVWVFATIFMAVFIVTFPFIPAVIAVLTSNAWWLLGIFITVPVFGAFMTVIDLEV